MPRERELELIDHTTALSERGGPYHVFQCRVNTSGQFVETDETSRRTGSSATRR